jgi:hypothetical protein
MTMAEYDVLDAFEYNIQKAKDLADAVDMIERGKGVGEGLYQSAEDLVKHIPHLLEVIESTSPITGRIESGFNECIDRLQRSGLEASIVMAVTAFETYLRDKYVEKKQLSDDDKSKLGSFMYLGNVKKRYEELGLKNLIGETTEQKLKTVLQMRHVIVHKAGIIDGKACKTAGWNRGAIGNNIKKFLDYATTTDAISVIEDFIRDLDEKTTR